jgi:hypothetical protein
MTYLHVAVIEGYEECLVSHTSNKLYQQVLLWLDHQTLPTLTPEEWAACIIAHEENEICAKNHLLGAITYYKTESHLDD